MPAAIGLTDLADLAARVDPRQHNRMQLGNLTVPALRCIAEPRTRLFAATEAIMRRARRQPREEAARLHCSAHHLAVQGNVRLMCPTGHRWTV
jgi:hypothetical protein